MMHWGDLLAVLSIIGVGIGVIAWFANVFFDKKWAIKSTEIARTNEKVSRELHETLEKISDTLTKLNIAFEYVKEDVRENSRAVKKHEEKINRLETKVEHIKDQK